MSAIAKTIKQCPVQWILVTLLICTNNPVSAGPEFPELTGRVVDKANMLNAAITRDLEKNLSVLETATTDQVVIVTLEDLDGYDIESYGYQLGRHWGIGQKDRNNGVLLIVAKKERKVRIEVGYGLEGKLTDAVCARIINNEIVPWFKQGNFNRGIEAGAREIIRTLGGKYIRPLSTEFHPKSFEDRNFGHSEAEIRQILLKKKLRRERKERENDRNRTIWLSFWLLFIVSISLLLWKAGFRPSSSGSDDDRDSFSSSRSGSSSGSSSFSGGGGSFGGGGASGSW